MLAPHAVDIAVIISSLCFTFAEPFEYIFLFVKSSCALVSGNTNKSLRPKEWPSEWIRARSLSSHFAFCKIVVKTLETILTYARHYFFCQNHFLGALSLKRGHEPFFFCICETTNSASVCNSRLKEIYRVEDFRASALKGNRSRVPSAKILTKA